MTTSYAAPAAPFNIWITPYAWTKLNHYAAEALTVSRTEIGGFAKLEINNNDVFVLDVEMIEQKTSAAFFEIDSEVVGEFTRKLVKDGKSADVPKWCSIVHSHPAGMSASMSGPDVKQISDFAAEQDAFSLIIAASPKADSMKMLMHYCGNVRGQKVFIRDMPVKMAYMDDRLELSKRLSACIQRFYKYEDEDDHKVVTAACDHFCTESLPGLLPSEIAEIAAEAKDMVPKLIQSRNPYPVNRYSAGPSWNAGRNPTGFQSPTGEASKVHDPPASTIPDVDVNKMTSDDRKRWYENIQLANGYDPRSKTRNVTKRAQRKAQERLQAMAVRYGVKSSATVSELKQLPPPKVEATAKVWTPKPGDIVRLKKDSVEQNMSQATDEADAMYLLGLVHSASFIEDVDRSDNSVIVDGFQFFRRELEYIMSPDDFGVLDDELLRELDINEYLLIKAADAAKQSEELKEVLA